MLSWIALGIGTLGTVGWAIGGRAGKIAAPLWFFSSVLWIVFAWRSGVHAIGWRDALNIMLYIYGARTSIAALLRRLPRKRKSRMSTSSTRFTFFDAIVLFVREVWNAYSIVRTHRYQKTRIVACDPESPNR